MLAELNGLFDGFAEMKEVKGTQVVAVANDNRGDYINIREDVGIFPMSITSYYKISGDEAEEALDYLTTKSVEYLNYGQNRLCYLLEETGEIAAFVTLYKNDECFILEVFNWNKERVEEILKKGNLNFEKLDYSCILLEGLKTIEFMTESMDLVVDYFVYQSHQDTECFNQEIMVARTGYTGEFGYKLIGDTESILKIWKNLLPEHKDKVVGYDAFEMCQYEIKQPFWELPYLSLSSNPFEVDYHWLVDFKKDTDYVGKEVFLGTKFAEASKRIVGALSQVESLIGDEVKLEGDMVGKVIDCRHSYGLEQYITMLLVDKEVAHPNIHLETARGEQLLTVSAPYIFPESWTAGRLDLEIEMEKGYE